MYSKIFKHQRIKKNKKIRKSQKIAPVAPKIQIASVAEKYMCTAFSKKCE